MTNTQPTRIKTISEYHRALGLPKPEHPLISVINFESLDRTSGIGPQSFVFDFYSISLKRFTNTRFRYGQQRYDFEEGVLFFMAPNQVFSIEIQKDTVAKRLGWIMLVHPDFIWKTSLAKTIKEYEFFSYSVHEALHLSDKEEVMILSIMQNIQKEYHSNIDKFTQDIIIAQIELLLNYSDRFYNRQFITRKIANHQVLTRLEDLLTEYFNSDKVSEMGLPTVQYIAGELNMSPGYLSSLLKTLTGQSTQQHIHDKLLEKAKEKLSTTDLSVSEIAFGLGFEHMQSFSKLFKTKTHLSPLEFRQSFN